MSDRDLIARLAHALRVQLDGVDLYSELLTEADARALLAETQPEPAGSTDPAWREFIEAVQHAQHVAKREGECPAFDLVETALALWRSAAPEPVSVDERLRLVAAGIRCGYMAGHDATVEGRYGDPDEVAAECATQVLQEQADG